MKYRLGILKKDGKIIAKNFNTQGEAEDYILTISEKENIKRADLMNKETKEKERIF